MSLIQIKSRWNDSILFELEKEENSTKITLEIGVNLYGVNLEGANLYGADLRRKK